MVTLVARTELWELIFLEIIIFRRSLFQEKQKKLEVKNVVKSNQIRLYERMTNRNPYHSSNQLIM